MESPTYMLVHGAWGGAWCWRDVAAEFDRRGVAWIAVDLPSSTNDIDPSTDLADDAAAVAAVATGDGPYVLVGHSYGGAVVAEIAPQIANLQRLVYVAALVPRKGQSPSDTAREVRARTLLDDAIEVDGEYLRLNSASATAALYGDCSVETARWAVERLSSQTLASFRSLRTSDDVDADALYIRCLQDRAIDPSLQDVMVERCDEVIDLDSDHSPFFSQPSTLCDALLS